MRLARVLVEGECNVREEIACLIKYSSALELEKNNIEPFGNWSYRIGERIRNKTDAFAEYFITVNTDNAIEELKQALEKSNIDFDEEQKEIAEYIETLNKHYEHIGEKWVYLEVNGCGYYSGAEYYEQVILTEQTYAKIKDELDKYEEISLGELDGKHSNVGAEVEVYIGDMSDMSTDISDGGILRSVIERILNNAGLIYGLEQYYVEEAYKKVDKKVTVIVNVMESEKESLLKLLKDNGYKVD